MYNDHLSQTSMGKNPPLFGNRRHTISESNFPEGHFSEFRMNERRVVLTRLSRLSQEYKIVKMSSGVFNNTEHPKDWQRSKRIEKLTSLGFEVLDNKKLLILNDEKLVAIKIDKKGKISKWVHKKSIQNKKNEENLRVYKKILGKINKIIFTEEQHFEAMGLILLFSKILNFSTQAGMSEEYSNLMDTGKKLFLNDFRGLDSHFFCKIPLEEYMNYPNHTGKLSFENSCPRIFKYLRYTENIIQFIFKICLDKCKGENPELLSPQEQALKFEVIIILLEEALAKGDFLFFSAVGMALNHEILQKQEEAWNLVPEEKKRKLEEFTAIISSKNEIRKQMRNFSGEVVPDITPFLADLTLLSGSIQHSENQINELSIEKFYLGKRKTHKATARGINNEIKKMFLNIERFKQESVSLNKLNIKKFSHDELVKKFITKELEKKREEIRETFRRNEELQRKIIEIEEIIFFILSLSDNPDKLSSQLSNYKKNEEEFAIASDILLGVQKKIKNLQILNKEINKKTISEEIKLKKISSLVVQEKMIIIQEKVKLEKLSIRNWQKKYKDILEEIAHWKTSVEKLSKKKPSLEDTKLVKKWHKRFPAEKASDPFKEYFELSKMYQKPSTLSRLN